jgi:hypothetical protein
VPVDCLMKNILLGILLSGAFGAAGQSLTVAPRASPYDSVFRVYRETVNPQAYLDVLRQVLDTASKHSAAYSWAACQTGRLQIRHFSRDSGLAFLQEVVSLNRSPGAVVKAIVLLDSLRQPIPAQAPSDGPFWAHARHGNIVYHVEVPTKVSVDDYIAEHDRILDSLLSYFDVALPKPVSFFVWRNSVAASRTLGRPVAFTNINELECHVASGNSFGHELTHAVSSVLYSRSALRSKFVYEGIAVAFDFSRHPKLQLARDVRKLGYASILDVWNREDAVPDSALYPLAGAFFDRMIGRLPAETIRQIVRVECLESVRAVTGMRWFNAFVEEFDREAGFCTDGP